MNEIKVTNELLSWVFGCECEFKREYGIGFCFIRTSKETKPLNNENIEFRQMYTGYIDGKRAHTQEYYINLHTFIHIAKIKAFEHNYTIIEEPFESKILDKNSGCEVFNLTINIFGDEIEKYSIAKVLKNLEWIAEKVGDIK